MLNLMMDSGAFSAFTQKKTVDLKAYSDFVLAQSKYIQTIVNLDVINPEGPEAAAADGMANFHYMLDRGIKAMPVFHARESLKWLDEMLNNVDYIGLSGTSLVSPEEDKSWHKLIWQYVTDAKGYPIAKFHSFGNTSEYMLLNMPFWSADSATWMIQGARSARIRLQGKSYQVRSFVIGDNNFISPDDTGLKRESWEAEIRDLGVNPNKFMTAEGRGAMVAMMRSYLVAAQLCKLRDLTVGVDKFNAPSSLIVKKRQQFGGFVRGGPVNIYLVISPSAYAFNFPIIAALGFQNILVSYFYVVTATKIFWEERLLPFMHDPIEYLERDARCRMYRDKLNEILLKPIESRPVVTEVENVPRLTGSAAN